MVFLVLDQLFFGILLLLNLFYSRWRIFVCRCFSRLLFRLNFGHRFFFGRRFLVWILLIIVLFAFVNNKSQISSRWHRQKILIILRFWCGLRICFFIFLINSLSFFTGGWLFRLRLNDSLWFFFFSSLLWIFVLSRLEFVFFLLLSSSKFFGFIFSLSSEHFFILTDFLRFSLVFSSVGICRNDRSASVVQLEWNIFASFFIMNRGQTFLITGISRFISRIFLHVFSRGRWVNVPETCLATLRTVNLINKILLTLDNTLQFSFISRSLDWFRRSSGYVWIRDGLIFTPGFTCLLSRFLRWWSPLSSRRISLLLELARSSCGLLIYRLGLLAALLLFGGSTGFSLIEIIWRHIE